MKHLLSRRIATFVSLLAASAACDDTSEKSSSSTVAPKASSGTDDTASVDCTDLKKSQGPSEPCCPKYGEDACGANLFCAAFEGRKTPTCYVEGQQRGGEECTAAKQCASNVCASSGTCAGLHGDTCDVDAGCETGDACVARKCVATSGAIQAPCDADDDCEPVPDGSGGTVPSVCARGRCGYKNGVRGTAVFPSECASRFASESTDGSKQFTCAACSSDADCLTAEGREKFEVCQTGICVHTCLNDAQCGAFVCKTSGCAGDAAYTCVDKFCR